MNSLAHKISIDTHIELIGCATGLTRSRSAINMILEDMNEFTRYTGIPKVVINTIEIWRDALSLANDRLFDEIKELSSLADCVSDLIESAVDEETKK